MTEFEILLTEFPILVLQWFRRISSFTQQNLDRIHNSVDKTEIYNIQKKFVHMHYK